MNGIANIGQPAATPYPPAKPVAANNASTAVKERAVKERATKEIIASVVAASEQGQGRQSAKPTTERDFDRYIPAEPPVSAGEYRPVTDKDGNRRIVFDAFDAPEADGKAAPAASDKAAPESDNEAAPAASDKAAPKSDKKATSSCTANTDKVDAEIRRLKKKQAKLEQQLAQADDRQRANLERQLAKVEAELHRKDNDAYRKQHAVVTENP